MEKCKSKVCYTEDVNVETKKEILLIQTKKKLLIHKTSSGEEKQENLYLP